ncbi:metallophosphoesterase [Variovorax sp. W2I14]|uniref:metallophosphoesterase n=1 Tax=Variovorax sp. W2I14 TaxID=3042290 RepID=UPI003D24182C
MTLAVANSKSTTLQATDRNLRFLHLSDIHVGMELQGWLWPTFKKHFLDDLERTFRKSGPWDVVIFSGDLTQRADPKEYAKLTEILLEIWAKFGELGCQPFFFPIPGNHDLLRPSPMASTARAFKDWWDEPEIQKAFWKSDPIEYRGLINSIFDNYSVWFASLPETGLPMPKIKNGILPGDSSARIELENATIGLVGLNSAWLQLGDWNYEGQLEVHPKQLLGVTEDDADSWCAKNDFNLLVTHHPVSWLNPKSLALWRSEIYLSPRFDCHLFGHMHQSMATSISEGGAAPRRMLQAASIFGLESISKQEIQRTHGYSAFRISKSGAKTIIRQWPRLMVDRADGTRCLVQDFNFAIDEDGSYEVDSASNEDQKLGSQVALSEIITNIGNENNLKTVQKTLPEEQAHIAVRKAEQGVAAATLENRTLLWVVSDWGAGSHEFLRSVTNRLNLGKAPVYQIDVSRCSNIAEMMAAVEEQVGVKFPQFCDQLALQPPCLLILEDAANNEEIEERRKVLELGISEIAKILLEYCDDLKLVVTSRTTPIYSQIKVVELKPLDQADTATYVAEHPLWAKRPTTPEFIARFHRYTGGIPTRIDAALRDIPLVGVTELLSLDTDSTGKSSAVHTAPPGLAETIEELRTSSDPNIRRAFELLRVLTLFPRGEQLATVKRFHSTKPFYPQDARFLANSALVDVVEIPIVANEFEIAAGSALVVRRQVRDYIYAIAADTELRALNRRAFAIYFGENWSLKGIKTPKELKFDDRNCGDWKIGNASMLILRAVKDAVFQNTSLKVKSALDLATSYCTSLMGGDRWNSIVMLCADLMPVFRDSNLSSTDLWILNSLHAQSLRMIGKTQDALDIYLSIVPIGSSSGALKRQENLLNLALCYERLEKSGDAVSAAKKCIELNSRNSLALQAQSIVLEHDANSSTKDARLQKLEVTARKKGAATVASTLALERARKEVNKNNKREILNAIVNIKNRQDDQYNVMRATLSLAEMDLDDGKHLGIGLLGETIEAYHYLYSENLSSIFEQCTEVLWKEFENSGQTDNLLSLFRHSSLIWRLRGVRSIEEKYLLKLSRKIGASGNELLRGASRELAYFVSRASELIKNSSDGIEAA